MNVGQFFGDVATMIDPRPHPYEHRPAAWTRDKLKEHLTVDEAAVLDSVARNRYTAVKSAHDLGKSFSAARLVAHFIETNKPGDAFVVTTAPTDAQVKAVLWQEIAEAHRKGDLRGRILENAQWKLDVGAGPDKLVAYGRKPSNNQGVALYGTHRRRMLIVIDEAGGVPKGIFDAIDALTTNEDDTGEWPSIHVLAIGNPDDPLCHFATICKPGSGWHVMTLDGLRSPNFTADRVSKFPLLRSYMIREGIEPSTEPVPDEVRGLLLSPTWVDERLRRWGPNNPLFMSRVRGEFPKSGAGMLIEPGWVLAAQRRELVPIPGLGRLGVDVARYGDDQTIIVHRQGPVLRVAVEIAHGPTTGVSGAVIEYGRRQLGAFPPPANVDDDGVGGGVTDELMEAGYPVLPLHGGMTATEMMEGQPPRPKFDRLRSQWWWHFRELLQGPSGTGEDGLIDLDPDDEEMAAQLLAVKYHVNSRGQVCVESKDQMRARGVSSPDRGDAAVYATIVDAPVPVVQHQHMMTGALPQAW